jgi:hypothetical protein
VTGLLERDVLVISQKAKLIEMTNEYRILDPEGEQVGRSGRRVSRRRRSCSAKSATSINS